MACDALAMLSHWLTTKKSKDGDEKCGSGGIDMNRRTFKQSTWEAWN